ncbi:hypothetical protein BSZ35_06915 [Salinibacter sp. 10B]|uniref:hypothetical protein n=1 Tax=Salinibacter sp. 10B TaxID=1923971 RepID=UPI000CF3E35B|nr:hypothetical protein [Salinibacter sp. 10B]PQJ34367.1 hypothetical protein BSZ35_06915 [Salinibacter sp. 10B]
MEDVRRVILYLSGVIGVWVLVSFGGTMFDTANASLWVNSLMWSLLSSLIVLPALLLVTHAATKQRSQSASPSKESPSQEEPEPFVKHSSDEIRTLWPEPEQKSEWPPNDVVREQKQAREKVHTN